MKKEYAIAYEVTGPLGVVSLKMTDPDINRYSTEQEAEDGIKSLLSDRETNEHTYFILTCYSKA